MEKDKSKQTKKNPIIQDTIIDNADLSKAIYNNDTGIWADF